MTRSSPRGWRSAAISSIMSRATRTAAGRPSRKAPRITKSYGIRGPRRGQNENVQTHPSLDSNRADVGPGGRRMQERLRQSGRPPRAPGLGALTKGGGRRDKGPPPLDAGVQGGGRQVHADRRANAAEHAGGRKETLRRALPGSRLHQVRAGGEGHLGHRAVRGPDDAQGTGRGRKRAEEAPRGGPRARKADAA